MSLIYLYLLMCPILLYAITNDLYIDHFSLQTPSLFLLWRQFTWLKSPITLSTPLLLFPSPWRHPPQISCALTLQVNLHPAWRPSFSPNLVSKQRWLIIAVFLKIVLISALKPLHDEKKFLLRMWKVMIFGNECRRLREKYKIYKVAQN